MKRLIVCALDLIAVVATIIGQPPPLIEWQKSYGGSLNEAGKCIIPVSAGGYLVSSISNSTDGDLSGNILGREVWLLRLNDQGGILWQNWLGSVDEGQQRLRVRETADGGFIAVTVPGYNAPGVACNTSEHTEGWLFKVDEAGSLLWQDCLGGSANDAFSSIERTSDGGYILCGGSLSEDGDLSGSYGSSDMWVVRLDADANIIWSRNYGGTKAEGAVHAIQTTDVGFLIGGSGRSDDVMLAGCNPYSTNNNTVFILKITGDGDLDWIKCYGGSDHDVINKILQDVNGNYWIIGTTRSTDGIITSHQGEIDGWIVKLDSEGELIDNRTFGGSSLDFIEDAEILGNGQMLVIGYTLSSDGDIIDNHGNTDAWLLLLDQDLNIVWQETYGGYDFEYGRSLTLTNDGAAILSGGSGDIGGDVTANNGGTDTWVVKLKPWDDTSVEVIESEPAIVAYPNPANDVLYLELAGVSVGNDLSVNVYDPLGRLAFSQPFDGSKGRLAIPLGELAMGTYHVRTVVAGKPLFARFLKL